MIPDRMNCHKFLLAALLTLLAFPAARAAEYSHVRIVRLSLADGDVQLSSADSAGWQKAIVNTPLREGMSVATGQGHAEIEFENGATARLADNTVLQFTELALADGDKVTRLNLSQGTASIYTNRNHHDRFELQAGKLAITVRDNARFRVDVFQDGASVSVQKGDLEAQTAGGSERVKKGQTIALRNDAADQIVLERNPSPDSWDRWVSDRDNAINVGRSDALGYMSSPISYGLADLSYYGGWYNYGGYGNCWRPYGVSFGWTPFYSGSWSYLSGFGFTWVSAEPWGWMPYHYGRWAFSPTLGWLWVPGNFHAFNPGAVYWTNNSGVVGWVPQAPHDRPGVAPQNLPHGVITNTTTGLAKGSPNHLGALPAGDAPRFFTDTRAEEAMVRTGEQMRAAEANRLTQSTALSGVAPSVARWSPGSPRRMSQREIITSPSSRVYTVVPGAPRPSSAASSAPGQRGQASRPSSPSPRPSSPRPERSSPPRPAPSAPASHSSPAPSAHPPSSHPR